MASEKSQALYVPTDTCEEKGLKDKKNKCKFNKFGAHFKDLYVFVKQKYRSHHYFKPLSCYMKYFLSPCDV